MKSPWISAAAVCHAFAFISSAILPSVAAEDRYALIYNGPVAADEAPEALADIAAAAGLPVRYTADLSGLPALLPRTAIFMIGGTEDDLSPLINAFTPAVDSALRTYLQNGGNFLGVCGGAFLASTGWEEDRSFVKMLGIVPAVSSDYDEEYYEPQIISVWWQGKLHPMYYQAGPAFDLTATARNALILARYEDGRIAALRCPYGQGMVMVCGPHPEAPASWSEEARNGGAWTSTQSLLVDALKAILQPWNAGQQALGGGWQRLTWFGDYVPLDQGWHWHSSHGYFYVWPDSVHSRMYLYTRDMGWLFTSRVSYPYLYRVRDASWLWYQRGSRHPRWFSNLRTGQWERR